MTGWLEGFDKAEGNDGGTFIAGVPLRLVLHTTEGSSAAGALAAFKANNTWPHFTVDAGRKTKVQHLPLNVAGRALKHPAGTGETNREGAIQIEMVGFAATSQDTTDEALAWFATEVVAPILAATGITTDHPAFVGAEAGTVATTTAKQRFTPAQWQTFHGICGHQHVPNNDHWDPGHYPIDAMLAHLGGAPNPSEEDDMNQPYIARLNADLHYQGVDFADGYSVYVVGQVIHHITPDQFKARVANGRPVINMDPNEMTDLFDMTTTDVHRLLRA